MYLIKKDLIIVIGLSLLFIILSTIGWLILHEAILLISLALIMGLFMTILIEFYRRIHAQLRQQHRQVESLFSLFSLLKVRYPLPLMGEWAISPDFANLIASLILDHKPRLVLEAGSGVSTLVAAYCIKEIGVGTIVSLEHDERFAEISTANVAKHGLQDIATISNASLKKVTLQDKSWLWYDTEQLSNLRPIDMLIIDGPPGKTQRLARYPALPILFHQLSDDVVILLDDTLRADESEIVKAWLKEFNCFSLEEVDTEHGAVIIRRQRTTLHQCR